MSHAAYPCLLVTYDFESEGREFESLRARRQKCLRIKGFRRSGRTRMERLRKQSLSFGHNPGGARGSSDRAFDLLRAIDRLSRPPLNAPCFAPRRAHLRVA